MMAENLIFEQSMSYLLPLVHIDSPLYTNCGD